MEVKLRSAAKKVSGGSTYRIPRKANQSSHLTANDLQGDLVPFNGDVMLKNILVFN